MDWNYYSAGVNNITTRKGTLMIPKIIPRLNGNLMSAYIFSHKPGVTVLLRPFKSMVGCK